MRRARFRRALVPGVIASGLASAAACQLVTGAGDYTFTGTTTGTGASGGAAGAGGSSGGAGGGDPCGGAPMCGRWGVTFPVTGATGYSQVYALARNGSATVAVGDFGGTATFAPGATVGSSGLIDFFAVRVSDDGQRSLIANYGGNGLDVLAGTAALEVGSDYWVAGTNLGTPTMGGQQLTGTGVFFARFGPNLNAVVAYPTPSINAGDFGAIARDAGGNLYAAGSFGGTVDFGGGPLTATAVDGIVVALDANGAFRWATQFGGATDQHARGVAIDTDGSVVVGGEYTTELLYSGHNVPGTAATHGFIVRLRALDGADLGFRGITGTTGTRVVRTVSHAGGALLVAGDFSGESNISGSMQTASDAREVFVAGLDTDLSTLWHVGIGGNVATDTQATALDVAAGRVTLGFVCPSQIRFNGGTILGGAGKNVCLAALSSAGAPLWAVNLGDDRDQNVTSVRALPDGAVVGGALSGAMDLGAGVVVQGSLTRTEGYVFRFVAP